MQRVSTKGAIHISWQFKKQRGKFFNVFVLLLFSLALLVLDNRTPVGLERLRAFLSFAVLPVHFIAKAPSSWFQTLDEKFRCERHLVRENQRLTEENLTLKLRMAQLASLEQENAQLRGLLASAPRITPPLTLARIVSSVVDPFSKKLIIDKGSAAELQIGQAVIDGEGVLGQIVRTYPRTAEVLLLTDPNSAVPVQDNRSGIRSVLIGTGDDSDLLLRHVTKTAEIQVGDELFTSGLGGHFPEGYPVGTVTAIRSDPASQFAEVHVKPRALLNHGQFVLVAQTQREKHDAELEEPSRS